jgi:RimK family alpha-L-glutamate ligase
VIEPVVAPSRLLDVAILSARTGWQTDELLRALAARGHRGRVAPYEALVARLGTRAGVAGGLGADGVPLDAMDAVLARIIPGGSLDQIVFRVDALHWLEERGVAVVNAPRAIERCVDKFYTSALLQEAGLPTPETIVCERLDVAMDAVRAMGDVVIKPLFGAMGHGMVRVSDPDTAWRVLRALELARAVYYVQQTVDHGGRDVRVFVVGDRVLGAIERLAPEGEWRTNVSRGGEARAFDLPPAWARMALEAARVVGADYAGVDLLPAPDGSAYVLEVNGIPGWEGLQRATGIDVADAIVAQLEARVGGRARIAVRPPEPAGRA